MIHRWQIVILLQVTCLLRLSMEAIVSSGQVYPLAYMNITTDREEEGFVQLYGYSINETQIRVTAMPNGINQFSTVGTIINNKFNLTDDFNEATFSGDVSMTDNTEQDRYGIISSSSDNAYFIGVKSDRGSTDAYLALPLMRKSTEFFVAGWPYNPPFYASCVIVPALSGTCVEVYKVHANQTYRLLGEGSLSQFDTLRYYADYELDTNGKPMVGILEDMTGYFINATKPVQVICGHECANVPQATPFCDHMAEQIPPINQLGTYHVVPPIDGRNRNAGYVVRVVATEMATTIRCMGNLVVKDKGAFVQFNTSDSMVPIVVECDKRCLVMQYNKGRRSVPSDIPTDPFMMLVVPSDHFTSAAGFATPNYCDVAKVRIPFDNYVSIVTFPAYRDNILFDGEPILYKSGVNTWDITTIPGHAIITFRITHDFHYVSNAPGTFGSFAVYPYGHSILTTSSSAYGFSANYNITGDPVTDVWEESKDALNQYLDSLKNVSCANESTLVNPILAEVEHVTFPFTLSASFDPLTISEDCIRDFYNLTLWNKLTDFTRLINQWICATANCSYLNGRGVAINYKTLSVQFVKDNQGHYNGIYITVEVIASLDTKSSDMATCRLQIKNFMTPFINWPGLSTNLFPSRAPPGCPWPLNFNQPAFVAGVQYCPADSLWQTA